MTEQEWLEIKRRGATEREHIEAAVVKTIRESELFKDLLEICNTDPAHIALPQEPETVDDAWLCGVNYVTDDDDFLDLRRTEEDARY